jgi:hypothetical protein
LPEREAAPAPGVLHLPRFSQTSRSCAGRFFIERKTQVGRIEGLKLLGSLENGAGARRRLICSLLGRGRLVVLPQPWLADGGKRRCVSRERDRGHRCALHFIAGHQFGSDMLRIGSTSAIAAEQNLIAITKSFDHLLCHRFNRFY